MNSRNFPNPSDDGRLSAHECGALAIWYKVAAGAGRLACSLPTKANRFRPRPVAFLGIVSGGAASRRSFSGISQPCVPALLHSRLVPPSSALKTSLLRAARIFELISDMLELTINGVRSSVRFSQQLAYGVKGTGSNPEWLFSLLILSEQFLHGVVVTHWIERSPTAKANRVRFPAGRPPPRIFTRWYRARRCRGFSQGSPVSPTIAFHPYSSRFTHIGSSPRRVNPLRSIHSLSTAHRDGLGSTPGRVTPGFSHVGIVPYDAADRRVFSGISHFPRPFVPALLHTYLVSPSSDLKTTMLRAAQISSLAHWSTRSYHVAREMPGSRARKVVEVGGDALTLINTGALRKHSCHSSSRGEEKSRCRRSSSAI
ncbi:hypothetical protein PR048_022775 [Dryococelus australis]|uniref:Uncharacterized protein n=1 Tax=Dryococelus australis TaxID=614101 RepID=A0ABQ9GS62_9NEOP|nr:hypothetical protein PR048_022775 [Dryococelus australis]